MNGWFFQAHISGYPVTILCPYVVYYQFLFTSHWSTLAPLHSAPLEPLSPLSEFRASSSYMSVPNSESDSESVSAPLAFAFSQSIPFWSHHLIVTLAPLICVVPSQRSRSGRVAMYCATVFCLMFIDVRTSLKPASFMAPSREG